LLASLGPGSIGSIGFFCSVGVTGASI